MHNAALDSFAKRRTQYAIGKNLLLSHAEIADIIKEAVQLAPSAFNSQSSRALILFGQQSNTFWQLVESALQPLVTPEAFEQTAKKLSGFAAGVGTVLFFEDQDVVEQLQEQFVLYADNFPVWSEHSTGIAQFAVWCALSDAGVGASLQHYNPLVDDAVRKEWNIPASWKLRAQMPFGSNEADFPAKTYMDEAKRFIVVP
ncbi:nitroreductase family protein [Stenotrophomonas geniculata]|uniref:nitroreductase family protein n=1 Tax=Stenotrophomonas geniculata TaxID=86188 RepID=UPI003D2D7939